MGNSKSADLNTILQSPSGPMRALEASWITRGATRVHVKAALTGTSASVIDAATNDEVYAFKDRLLSSRSFLKTPEGRVLVTVKKNVFSSKFHVFLGDQTEHEQLTIRDATGIFNTMILVAEFYDHKTGSPCRVVVKGRPSKRVVLCYLERGNPTLSQLQKSEDLQTNIGCYEPIGRISRENKILGRDEYEVEAFAGVDMTLLLLIWHVRQILREAERSSSG